MEPNVWHAHETVDLMRSVVDTPKRKDAKDGRALLKVLEIASISSAWFM